MNVMNAFKKFNTSKLASTLLKVQSLGLKSPSRCLISLSDLDASPKEVNRRLRIQLAAAHRGLAEYKMNDRVFNHLSVLAPSANEGGQEVMLITPFPCDFADVTPSSLLAINSEGDVVEGDISLHQISGSFHRGFYMSNPNSKCMMHTHSPYLCALAALEDPTLKMINQTSTMCHKMIGYDMDYGGIVDDLEEGKRLGNLLGDDKKGLILANHGALTAGPSVAAAFFLMISMELSAQYQITAMQTQRKLLEIKPNILAKNYETLKFFQSTPLLDVMLAVVIEKLGKTNPEFRYEI